MNFILAIIGALLGAAWSQFGGLVCGAVLGYLMGEMLSLRRIVRALESEVRRLSQSAQVSGVAERRAEPAAKPTLDESPAISVAVSKWQPPEPLEQSTGSASDVPTSEPASEPVLVRWLREYFTGGNTLVRVGVIVLFFGVAFLLKYAAEHTTVPIELRLAGAALGAIVLLVLGWRLREKRSGYAYALQGAAVGILYLTTFAALRIYALLPATAAFLVLVSVGVFSAVLAVLQNSSALATLGICGGFLAPVLTSTGQGSHVVLFGYYAVLNAGILGIAWFRAWRPLNVLGFAFTFVIGTAWGVLRYRNELFASTEPFLILFFLFYVAVAILYALRQPPDLKGYVDATLVFGLPLIAFALQATMLRHDRYAIAASALAVSAFYLVVTRVSWSFSRERLSVRPLTEAFLSLGVVFMTLAIPLALDGQWTSATWAVEGAALVWLGGRQERRLARAAGVLLQFAAGMALLNRVFDKSAAIPVVNGACLGSLILTAAALFSARLLQVYEQRLRVYERPFGAVMFVWGMIWWLVATIGEIQRQIAAEYQWHAMLLATMSAAAVASVLYRLWRWQSADWLAKASILVLLLFALGDLERVTHPFAHAGFIAWPLAFSAFYWICREHDDAADGLLARLLHVPALWLLIALVLLECNWAIERAAGTAHGWTLIAPGLIPALALSALTRWPLRWQWPVRTHRDSYLLVGGAGIATSLAIWSLTSNALADGTFAPLYYLPLLNPIDVTHGFAIVAMASWWLAPPTVAARVRPSFDLRVVYGLCALVLFVWFNSILLRSLHQYAAVPFALEQMLRSTLVQTALSIFWTVLALSTMLLATRQGVRVLWFSGAALMGVVVAKLFLLDLSRIGTVERIVSFIGVGLLMLVIGYFSPLPPGKKAVSG